MIREGYLRINEELVCGGANPCLYGVPQRFELRPLGFPEQYSVFIHEKVGCLLVKC